MILQKRAPRLRPRLAAAHHVFADIALSDVDAELEQFTVDAWCAPSGILPAHLADQISDLARNEWSSGLAAPHLPGAEQSKSGTMPGKDRFWLDDGQRRAPVMPEAGQADPQQAVGGGQFQAFCRRSLKHSDLVAQSQVLEVEGGTRLEDRANRRKEVRKISMSENYKGCVTPYPLRYFDIFERPGSESCHSIRISPRLVPPQCVGIVRTGWFSFGPVSTIVKSIIMSEKTCLDSRSPSSIQNQLFRYLTDTKASGDIDFPLCMRQNYRVVLGQGDLGQGFTPQWISVRCSENRVQRADELGSTQLSGVVSRSGPPVIFCCPHFVSGDLSLLTVCGGRFHHYLSDANLFALGRHVCRTNLPCLIPNSGQRKEVSREKL